MTDEDVRHSNDTASTRARALQSGAMQPSIFTRIIDGEIPGRVVWSDELCIAMVDIRPLSRGHCLVIPRVQVDQWTDLDADLVTHLMRVAHNIANAQKAAFSPARVGLLVAGFEVPHTHLHIVPLNNMADLDFAQADEHASAEDLDDVATTMRATLTELGFSEAVAG